MTVSEPKSIKIKVQKKEFIIKDKYTLIKGDFELDDLSHIPYPNFFKIIDNFNEIPLEKFVKLTNDEKEKTKSKKDITQTNLLSYVEKFQKSLKSTTHVIEEYFELSESFKILLKFNILNRKRENLHKELELSKIKKKSSKIAAKTDLIDKLQKSIEENKEKLQYLEEDYFKLKNRRSQIKNTIEKYQTDIKEFNKAKKDCFKEINKLTREMSEPSKEKKQDREDVKEIAFPVTQKIRALRKKAKEYHRKVKETKNKLRESQSKLKKIKPNYEQFQKDYDTLTAEIKRDDSELENLQRDLKINLDKEIDIKDLDIDYKEIDSVRSETVLKNELNRIENELESLSSSNEYIQEKNPQKMDSLFQTIKDFKESLETKKKGLLIEVQEDQILKSINSFRNLESLINKLNTDLNKFLSQINLEVNFNILIAPNYQNFLLELSFVRSKKEQISFQDLTTPEKVFLVITFFLSFLIQVHSKELIFSNVILPDDYNKRGSLFRTLRKIIPVFKQDPKLQDYKLIFLISKLEMKRTINNINIIKLNKS